MLQELSNLCSKTRQLVANLWTPAHAAAFTAIRNAIICSAPKLIPDFTKELFLYTDSSNVACSGILTQLNPDGFEQIVWMYAMAYSATQQRMRIQQKEAFALLLAVRKLGLKAMCMKIIWRTDNRNLLSMWKSEDPRIAGIFHEVGIVIREVQYIPGCNNVWADFLSRNTYMLFQHILDEAEVYYPPPSEDPIPARIVVNVLSGLNINDAVRQTNVAASSSSQEAPSRVPVAPVLVESIPEYITLHDVQFVVRLAKLQQKYFAGKPSVHNGQPLRVTQVPVREGKPNLQLYEVGKRLFIPPNSDLCNVFITGTRWRASSGYHTHSSFLKSFLYTKCEAGVGGIYQILFVLPAR